MSKTWHLAKKKKNLKKGKKTQTNSRWPRIGLCGAPSKLLTYAEITMAFTTGFVVSDLTFGTSSEISN